MTHKERLARREKTHGPFLGSLLTIQESLSSFMIRLGFSEDSYAWSVELPKQSYTDRKLLGRVEGLCNGILYVWEILS